MKNTINYAALSMDDIIFIDRNKDYGAYELRRSYEHRIRLAMLGSLFITAMLCGYQLIYSHHHPTAPQVIEQVVSDMTDIIMDPPPVTPPPPKVDPPKPQGTEDPNTVTNATLVSSNTDHPDSVPTNDMLANAAISDHISTGTTAGTIVGTENSDIELSVKAPPAPISSEPVNWAQIMPEYPGGEEALKRFISDNIRYPDMERENSIGGKVVVGFVIDENGKVNDIRILKGQTRGLNSESSRVVALLKTFKPGIQGGQKVKVRYSLPINFQIKDE